MTIPVYEHGEIVARVEYNDRLDHWDGQNYSSGAVGKHLGFTQLEDGRFVLIHGTQWQGERDTAEIVSPERIVKEALRGDNEEELEDFPELIEVLEKMPNEVDTSTSKTFSIRVNRRRPEAVDELIEGMRQKIEAYLKET